MHQTDTPRGSWKTTNFSPKKITPRSADRGKKKTHSKHAAGEQSRSPAFLSYVALLANVASS